MMETLGIFTAVGTAAVIIYGSCIKSPMWLAIGTFFGVLTIIFNTIAFERRK